MIARLFFLAFLTCPFVSAEWKPAECPLMTTWAKNVTPENAWKEYPRPQLRRESWTNLNGLWDYAVTPKGTPVPAIWDGQILVPFPPQASLSGVGKEVSPQQTLWYRKQLSIHAPENTRTLLHFGAVDYEAFVSLNGKEVGTHKGGHTPFSIDITSALQDGGNEILLRIVDDVEGTQLHGKQTLKQQGIWGPNITGIWQTVWLEHVPQRSIRSLHFDSDTGEGRLDVKVGLAGKALPGEKLRLTARVNGTFQAETEGDGNLSLKFQKPLLWSPEEPNLYDLELQLLDAKGKVIDTVQSYAALRKVTKERDEAGNLRICINGKPTFLFGPLDQGWWPDGLLTPPSDEAMVAELEFLKSIGFNMLRKHVKVEPARYYYHCDRLGIAVWQDQVSSNYNEKSTDGHKPRWNFMRPNPIDGTWPPEAHEQWVTEYKRMVDFLRNHPSVVIWGPFNEAWGQHQSMEIGQMAMDYDKTRLVSIASGGNFWPVGDIASAHAYPGPSFPLSDERFKDYVKVVGEMGGHGFAVPGHTLSANENWGYGGLTGSINEWKSRYQTSIERLEMMKRRGVAAAVYTQTADFFGEMNGLMTFDRLQKTDAAWIKQTNAMVMSPARNRRAPSVKTNPTPSEPAQPGK